MIARTAEIDSLEPWSPSRPVSEPAGRDQGAPCQDAETPCEQSAMIGGSLPGYERDRRGQCPRVPKEAPSHRRPHSGDGQPFR